MTTLAELAGDLYRAALAHWSLTVDLAVVGLALFVGGLGLLAWDGTRGERGK